MLLVLGLIIIGLFCYFVGKTAKENGRNALIWTLTCAGVGVGLQFVVPIFVGLAIGIVLLATGTPASKLQETLSFTTSITLSLIFLVLSLVGMWLILRHVAKLPEDDLNVEQPPPPPTFGSSEATSAEPSQPE